MLSNFFQIKISARFFLLWYMIFFCDVNIVNVVFLFWEKIYHIWKNIFKFYMILNSVSNVNQDCSCTVHTRIHLFVSYLTFLKNSLCIFKRVLTELQTRISKRIHFSQGKNVTVVLYFQRFGTSWKSKNQNFAQKSNFFYGENEFPGQNVLIFPSFQTSQEFGRQWYHRGTDMWNPLGYTPRSRWILTESLPKIGANFDCHFSHGSFDFKSHHRSYRIRKICSFEIHV